MKNSLLQVIKKYIYTILVLLAYLLFVYFISSIAFQRINAFYANYWDLGVRYQILTNTIHGHFFEYTHQYTQQNINYLGIHFEPIILVYALPFILSPTPYMIVFLQTIFVGIGIFFAFKLAKILLKNDFLAFLTTFLFILNPNLHTVLLFDMHGITLAIPILLYTFVLIEQKRYSHLLFPTILLLLTKEHVGFTISTLGLYLMFSKKQYKYGIFYTILGAIFPFFLIYFFMPKFANIPHEQLSIYHNLSVQGITQKIFSIRSLTYLKDVLLFNSPIAILSPFTLLMATPELLINILGKHNMQTFKFHYTSVLIPIFYFATLKALALISKFNTRVSLGVVAYSLIVLLVIFKTSDRYQYINPDASQIHNEINSIKNTYSDIQNYDTVVATSYFLGPYFSGRRVFFDTFNDIDVAATNYIIKKDISQRYNNAKYILILNSNITNFEQNIPTYRNILNDPNYEYISGYEKISVFVRKDF